MGLMEEFGAWLDQKKKNIAVNAQNLPGLLSSFAQDVQQGADADKSSFDAARSVMPGVRDAGIREMNARGQELGGLLGAIKAFHGSPHKFDKFDLSKIGTGEGAQAYGHGIYMAESPGVAGSYRDKLSKNEVLLDGQKVKHNRSDTSPQSMGLNALQMEPTPAAASAALRNAAADDTLWQRGSQYDGLRNNYLAAADWLDANAKRLQVDSGSLYEASIRWPDAAREAADPLGPQHFLDWDKPLSEQPEAVRKVARQFNNGKDPRSSMNGDELLRYIERQKRMVGGGKAEDAFRDAGIPGIRYLDGGSRGAGQGTSNYVVFDDNLLEILKRNGEPVQKQGLLSREPTKFELAHAEAQRNAALPIEQGGLGLGPNNTAMERAKAMGFDTDVYHGTHSRPIGAGKETPNINEFVPSVSFGSPNPAVFVTRDKGMANAFARNYVDNTGAIYPLKVRTNAGQITETADHARNNEMLVHNPALLRSRFAAFDPKKKDSRDLLASMGLLGLLGAGAYGQDQ